MRPIRRLTAVGVIGTIFLSLSFVPSQAKSIFYLDLKKGCYAGNAQASTYLEWSLPSYKTLYKKNCFSRYHYQVYAISKLTVNIADDSSAQNQASEICSAAAERRIANKNVDENLGIGWFFPDVGAEERKYGKKLICFFRIIDINDDNVSVVQNSPMA